MGIYSVSLLVGAANGVALAGLVAFSGGPRLANRLLAILIVLVALRLGPFILGYAGAYDAHRWLTFAPFDLSYAYGPLLWAYVTALTTGRLPTRWGLHLAPAALQLAYELCCFALPPGDKWDWYTGGHLKGVAPLGAAAGLMLAGVYLAVSARQVARYRAWLDGHFANRDEARLTLLRALLAAFGLTLLIACGFAGASWLYRPLDYYARFPLMVTFAVLTYALGLLGWRNSAVAYPHVAPQGSAAEPMVTRRDYAEQARVWRARLAASDWWRDEALDLAALAGRLAVSPRTLSRVLSEGAGQNFREFVARIRVEAVARALADPANDDDILTLALSAGFNAKASFNRAFRLYMGMTPSEHRRRAARPENRQSAQVADSAAI